MILFKNNVQNCFFNELFTQNIMCVLIPWKPAQLNFRTFGIEFKQERQKNLHQRINKINFKINDSNNNEIKNKNKNNKLKLAKLTHVSNTVLYLWTIVRNFAVDNYHCVNVDFANIIFVYFVVQHHGKMVVCWRLNGWSSSCTCEYNFLLLTQFWTKVSYNKAFC